MAASVTATQKSVEENKTPKPKRTVANRAARTVQSLRNTLKNWYGFYNGYDPMFTWWNAEPYKAVDTALEKYSVFILDKLVGIKPDDKTTIIGDPIGRAALLDELHHEMIPYTPEQLVEIANKEFAWCEAEMKKASRDMGYGDDWKKALEAVKQKYVEPGKQPDLIRDQAREAIEYVEKNQLVTVPALARDSWRMEMMTPERQLVSPFFLGGETILVSYPDLDHDARAENDEHARQQPAFYTGRHSSRADPGALPAAVHDRAAPPLPRHFLHAFLDGRMGPVLGVPAVGQGL